MRSPLSTQGMGSGFSLNSSSCKFCCWRRAAASVVNDALFAVAIALGLTADEPASDEHRLVCDDLERDVHVRDLDPVLLTESCGFYFTSRLVERFVSAF